MEKKLKKLLALLLALLMVLALFSCAGKKEESEPVDEPEEEQGDGSPTVTLSLNQLLNLANESWTFNELITRIFTDYVAYTADDGITITVAERKKDVPSPTYDYSKIVTDEKGFKYYDMNSETKKSWRGIDVSAYQEDIDWEAVANSGVDFAFIRLCYRGYTEGSLVRDVYFDRNVQGAIENGIGVGVYFVTQAITVEEAKEEARYVLENIKYYDVTWPLVYDIEGHSSTEARANKISLEKNTEQIVAFCETIKEAGYTPMVYSNTKWFVSKIDMSQIKDYDIWYAYYKDSVYFPYNFQIWQHSCTGRVNGISGDVDLNISFVNYGER